MTDNMLEGLELRKAVLVAAGWKLDNWQVQSRRNDEITAEITYYRALPPDGDTQDLLSRGLSESEAWNYAPAVELSVDDALDCLSLGDVYYWDLRSVPDEWLVLITNQDGSVAAARHPILAVAMCRAYLRYKGGA